MATQPQASKYIEKLVRIITQKQKIIDQLRRSVKSTNNQHDPTIVDESSIIGRKVREELTLNNVEIKLLHQKMSAMELKIKEFSHGLKEEIFANQQFKAQIQAYERRQRGLSVQIASLNQLNHKLQEKVAELDCKYSQALTKNWALQSIIADLQEKLQSFQTLQREKQKQKKGEQFLVNIQNKVQSILKIVNYHPLNEGNSQTNPINAFDSQNSGILKMLDIIEEVLRKESDCVREDILNDTLDGLSVIMRSFQDKKQGLNSFTQSKKRNNCSAGPILAMKGSVFLSQAKKNLEMCFLQKSKIQTTRLNDTSKLIEGFLSQ